MENVTLSKELANHSRAALYSWTHDHEEMINTLRSRMGFENSCDEFKTYAEQVFADEPINTHMAWFHDIIGTAKVIGETIYRKRNKARGMITNASTNNSGFDIYKYAEENPYADYMDMHTGYIYHIADYMRAKRFGLPTPGIAVSENGKIIGYAQKMS